MRRILRKFANNDMENLGDTSTLLNPEIVNEIKYSKQSHLINIPNPPSAVKNKINFLYESLLIFSTIFTPRIKPMIT